MARRVMMAAWLTVVLASPAGAAWESAGTGIAAAAAVTMPAGERPTATASGRDVRVEWDASVLAGGSPVDGYVVRRYGSSGDEEAVVDGCSGTVPGVSCVERALPAGAWRYTVAPVRASWTGQESPLGTAITVEAPSLSLSPANPTATSVSGTLSGGIAGFLDGETVRFRLDGPTGTLLPGTVDGLSTPASIPTGGSAAITITIPAGTSDGPHTVHAVASPSGESASAAFSVDMSSPVLTALEMHDNDANGKVDRVVAQFSENVVCTEPCTSPWSLSKVPSGGTLSSVTVAGSTATLHLSEGTGAADTAVGSFTVGLSSNASGVTDPAGNISSFAAAVPADNARPVPVSVTETNGGLTDGAMEALDTLTVTFSESLASASVPATTTVTQTDPRGAGNDTLTISGISNGALNSGSDGYIQRDDSSNSFAASTVALSSESRVLTVTVAGICSPLIGLDGCGTNVTSGGPGTLVFVPSPSLTDSAGNAAAGAGSAAFRLF